MFSLQGVIKHYQIGQIFRVASSNDQGFVLPYVLVVIAILAIATTIAADRLQKSTSILLKIKDQKRIERQLYTAEAEAIYGWLTGISVEGGIDLNSNNPVISCLLCTSPSPRDRG